MQQHAHQSSVLVSHQRGSDVTLSVSRIIHVPIFSDDFILSLILRQNTTNIQGRIPCRHEDTVKFSLMGGQTKYVENTSTKYIENT